MSEALGNELHPQQTSQVNDTSNRYCAEEDRAWAVLYAAIGQPSMAEEVVKQLDADPPSKRTHLALYIRARATLRKQKAAEARNQRLGALVRRILELMLISPLGALRAALSLAAHVAAEAMSARRKEPAKARAQALRNDPDFATAKERFASGAHGTRAAATEAGESRGPKAA